MKIVSRNLRSSNLNMVSKWSGFQHDTLSVRFQPIESLPFSDQERSLIESYRSIDDEKIKECIVNFAEFAGGK